MIRVNLLNSVTERQGGAVNSVERKVSSPTSRLMLMSIAVVLLLLTFIGFDIITTNRNKAHAEAQLEEQKKIAADLEAVLQEQKQLEQNIANIDARIEAIKKLRETQAGPSAVLKQIQERIGMTPNLYLQGIEQTGDQIVITGSSPDDNAITQFSSSLEFSAGLFSNLSIETKREEIKLTPTSLTPGAEAPKVEYVNFTIRCAYTPSKAEASQNSTTAANQPPPPAKAENGSQAANQPPADPSKPQVANN